MALPPQFLEELRSRLGLSDVVGKRMRLTRAGREFKAPCPFHNEKTPSFYLNDQKGFFHCFGCGAHGDIIGFVMRHDNLSFMEAVELLAGEAGLQVPKATPQERQKFERQKTLFDLVERACRYFEAQLRTSAGRAALDYLKGRGLEEEAISRFRLGYAPQDGAGLRHELISAGFSEAQLVEAGLFKRPDDGRSPFAFFRNRVMFPVTDRRGQVVAFGARILEGTGPKYINSADNPLFHKGRLLYGMSRARQAASDGQALVVTEGYMDVISCVLAGFGGAVAPLGTALTETQIQELWKLAPEGRRTPILCFDGDNAGRRAAFRAIERLLPLLQPDHSARVAFLPEKEDPDSLIRAGGASAFQIVLDRAKPLAEVLWDMEAQGRDLTLADERAGLEAALGERCKQIQHPGVRRAYEQDMRDRMYQFTRQSRRNNAAGGRGAAGGGGFGGARRPIDAGGVIGVVLPVSRHWDPRFRSGVVRTEPRWRERLLILPLLNHPELFEDIGETLAQVNFSDPELERLRGELLACLSMNSGLDADELRRHLSGRGFLGTLEGLLSADAPKFAQPGASIEAARSGWQEVWLASQELALQAELREAERRLVDEFSEENLARLEALRQEVLHRRGHAAGLTELEE
ncbi:DNA primase [Indioceanicola profundi]|uniref:DNA primase n=1 Tax=Indioceanicola profundi TaxID=2220096 RepID=UPI000E6ADA7C|nr:DNA primase [Indioceanicola profundi]